MIDLTFACTEVTAPRDTAQPTLRFQVTVAEPTETPIKMLALRCQIRIEPSRRGYSEAEGDHLRTLFGAGERWRDNLHPLQFANPSVVVPAFTGSATVAVDVPVTYDFEVTTARYFQALSDGEIPFILLFSGSAFSVVDGRLSVVPVSWSSEARTRMPLEVWQQALDTFFPGTTYLRVTGDTLAALQAYANRQGLPGWDATIGKLLEEVHADDA